MSIVFGSDPVIGTLFNVPYIKAIKFYYDIGFSEIICKIMMLIYGEDDLLLLALTFQGSCQLSDAAIE